METKHEAIIAPGKEHASKERRSVPMDFEALAITVLVPFMANLGCSATYTFVPLHFLNQGKLPKATSFLSRCCLAFVPSE
jgi:hypothetical protein